MNIKTLASEAEVAYNGGSISITGDVCWDVDRQYLYQMDEDEMPNSLSVNLDYYGLVPGLDQTFIKDYSENEGVTDELVKLGLVKKIGIATFGPFDTTAYLVEIL